MAGAAVVAARRPAQSRVTVTGEVKNYVPVTDAMLRNPDPSDWLMIRRDYKANYYSPLNQITAQNVNELRLVWSWAMQEGASNGNQPAPIVHNGVLYVNNTGMVLQALDAKTGELIWENRYGTNPTAPAMRGIAIYDDKIFVTTGERASDGLRCPQWQGGLGYHHRRSLQRRVQQQQRPARGERPADSGPGPRFLRDLSRREMLHQRL